MEKKIVINSAVSLPLPGSPYGPIVTPYMETIPNIIKLLWNFINVDEVLADGTKVKLDINNVDKDNSYLMVDNTISPDVVQKFTETVAPLKKEEVIVEEVTEEVVLLKTEEVIDNIDIVKVNLEDELCDDIAVTKKDKKNKFRK